MNCNLTANPVAFLDSGMGGLPYLQKTRQTFARDRYVYIADLAQFPYGVKSAAELQSLLLDLSLKIQDRFNPKGLVLACNTAALNGQEKLKERLNIPVIGVVPAIEKAAAASKTGQIAVLATSASLYSPAFDKKAKELSGVSVLRYPADALVKFIENELAFATPEERLERLFPIASFFLMEGFDAIVLGCTHFVYVQDDFERLMPDAAIVSAHEQLHAELASQLKLQRAEGLGQVTVYQTAREQTGKYQALAKRFFMDYQGFIAWT